MADFLDVLTHNASPIKEQWLPLEMAVRKVVAFEERFGSLHLLLACHAALPLILTPELLNLIHHNFLANEKISWTADADFLLSPLCRQIDDQLFEVEPRIREVLLFELEERYGRQHLLKVADFLLAYLSKKQSQYNYADVAVTQRWIALSYINPNEVVRQMMQFLSRRLAQSHGAMDDVSSLIHLVSSLEFIAEPLEYTSLQDAYHYLVHDSRLLAHMFYGEQKAEIEQAITSIKEQMHHEHVVTLFSPGLLQWLSRHESSLYTLNEETQETQEAPYGYPVQAAEKTFNSENWCDLTWTPWFPFEEKNDLRKLPTDAGIYRIRSAADHTIFYIDYTSRNLRERIENLASTVMQDSTQMPFSDPYAAAPALWAWRDADGITFECSIVQLSSTKEELEVLMHYLLWQYRLEQGHSTLCNFGRFHPQYVKSGSSQNGQRGYRSLEGEYISATYPSTPPLQPIGTATDLNWMGLTWSTKVYLLNEGESIPDVLSPVAYRVIDADSAELLLVGSTQNLMVDFTSLIYEEWDCQKPMLSFAAQPDTILSYQLSELINDLIGGYYQQNRMAPKFQFKSYPDRQPSQPQNYQTGQLDRRTLLHKRYQIQRVIGHGGMGAVYQAQDVKRQGAVCAIKEMNLSMVPPEEQAQAIQNFKIGAKILWSLNHPNLPVLKGFFSQNQRYFLVMEYIDGLTLEDYLERNRAPFPERRVLTWARQLCDVLEYMHNQNPPIIFRDMKPGNIMLTRKGQIKLIDFGIARPIEVADTQLLGTPGFAPPEQYGKAQTDARSDIYALGITLFQLLTNTPSDKGFGIQDVRAINPQVSTTVARALEKATALEPDERYKNVEAFRRALFSQDIFIFESGDSAASVEELAELCIQFPEEAADYLAAGEIELWLREIGTEKLSHAVAHIRTNIPDSQEAVEQFIREVMKNPRQHVQSSNVNNRLLPGDSAEKLEISVQVETDGKEDIGTGNAKNNVSLLRRLRWPNWLTPKRNV